MSLLIHHSPLNFFDSFIADCYRQMAAEMDKIRDQMFQLMPSDFPPLAQEPEMLVPIVEEGGERKLKMQFNVKDYKPEEVKVKIFGKDVVQVRAEHEEKNAAGETRRRLYIRQYRLPKDVNADALKPMLSKDEC